MGDTILADGSKLKINLSDAVLVRRLGAGQTVDERLPAPGPAQEAQRHV